MQYLIPFFLALAISTALTPLVRRIAVSKGLVARPRKDRWHKRDTALFGGIAIYVSFLIPYLIFSRFSLETLGIIVCGSLIFALGLFDDIIHIKPYTKLLGQIVVAALLVNFGVSIKIIPYGIISVPLTILWIVAIINAFNLLDNMDGLSAGIGAIISAVLAFYSFINGSPVIRMAALVLCGSLLGFLRFNFTPASIFMGDSGSMFIGFTLAALTLHGTWKESAHLLMALAVPFITLAVPLIDTVFVTIARSLAARGIFQGGTDHISHRLVVLGLPEKSAVLLLYAISLAFGLLSIAAVFLKPLVASSLIITAAIALVYFAVFLGKVKVYEEDRAKQLRKKNGNVIIGGMLLYKRRLLEVMVDFILVSLSYVTAYLLRFEGVISQGNQELIIKSMPLIVIIKYLAFFKFGLYRGIWRYVSIRDLINIFKAVTVGSFASALSVLFLWRFEGYSRAVFIIDWLLLFVLISGSRIAERVYKEIFDEVGLKDKRRVLIYGAGNAGEFVLREMKNNKQLGYRPVAFVDDDREKIGRRVHGVPVMGARKDIIKIARHKDIQELIIAIPHIAQDVWDDVEGFCRTLDIPCHRMSDILPK